MTIQQPPKRQDVILESHTLRNSMLDDISQSKILHTQVPLLKGYRKKFNESEHVLSKHLQQHLNELTEEQELNKITSRAFCAMKQPSFGEPYALQPKQR